MSETTLNRSMKIHYDFLPFVLVRKLRVKEIVSKINRTNLTSSQQFRSFAIFICSLYFEHSI